MQKKKKDITLEQALNKFWKKYELPGGPDIQTDNEDQIVIYTGMKENKDGKFTEL